jgi:hypothetical protein
VILMSAFFLERPTTRDHALRYPKGNRNHALADRNSWAKFPTGKRLVPIKDPLCSFSGGGGPPCGALVRLSASPRGLDMSNPCGADYPDLSRVL